MSKEERLSHEFQPIYNQDSRILILGTFPSVKSRENNFYYGHPQNRFWRLIAAITECEIPVSIEQKKELLLMNRIALWDVISECEITGSSDSSIKNVVPSDLSIVLTQCEISRIYANGNTAAKLFQRYSKPFTNMGITLLPSSSPANASYSLDRLLESWIQIRGFL